MIDIQRYLRCGRSGEMIPDSHGAWCKYDEIERLRGLLRECAAKIDGLLEMIRYQEQKNDRLRNLLLEYADVVRLIKEGKPVPLGFLEVRIRHALGDDLLDASNNAAENYP